MCPGCASDCYILSVSHAVIGRYQTGLLYADISGDAVSSPIQGYSHHHHVHEGLGVFPVP